MHVFVYVHIGMHAYGVYMRACTCVHVYLHVRVHACVVS